MRAVRYTLIVASTEHEFSSGCCRVTTRTSLVPRGVRLRRPLRAAAFFGRVRVVLPFDANRLGTQANWGLWNARRRRILPTPQCNRIHNFEDGCRKYARCLAAVGAHNLRHESEKSGLTSRVSCSTVRGCHLNGGETKNGN